jgi:hypothetical protein
MSNDINTLAASLAFNLGKEAGVNHAGWVAQDTFGGRIADARDAKANARAVVKAIDDCDFMPSLPDLSGQWSDDYTPAKLVEYICWKLKHDDVDSLDLDEICTNWEQGVCEGFEHEIYEQAKSVLS